MTVTTDPLVQGAMDLNQRAHDGDWRRYVRLLEKNGDYTSGEKGEFAGLMQRLRRSPDDVHRDRETLAKLHGQEMVLINGSGLEERIQAAHQAIVENEPKWRAAIEAAHAHHGGLRKALEQLQGTTQSARDALREIEKLKKQFPELLAGYEVPAGLGERLTVEKFKGFAKQK